MPPPAPPTAIVTGAASGIGLALARQLIDLGYQVAAVDRDADRLAGAAELLGTGATPHEADVADAGAWRRLIERLRARWQRLDLLVNNAGVLAGGELCGAAVEDTQRVLATNLRGTLLGCQLAGEWLIDSSASVAGRGGGRAPLPGVINVASIFAAVAPPGFAVYSASKAGVVALSESLRGELAPHGLNVTVALPGTTPTALFADAAFSSPRFAEVIDKHQQASVLSADSVAKEILEAAARGRLYVVVGGRAKRMAFLKRLSPAAILGRVAEQARRELGLPNRTPRAEN